DCIHFKKKGFPHVFRSSQLFRKTEECTLIPENAVFHYAGVYIPPLILGDGAYPLCKWLIKPYAVPRNDRGKHYNKVFNRTRTAHFKSQTTTGVISQICSKAKNGFYDYHR
ncbi:hypothetical protein JRQ81_019489, partial [Phrynocephalus forsythii]